MPKFCPSASKTYQKVTRKKLLKIGIYPKSYSEHLSYTRDFLTNQLASRSPCLGLEADLQRFEAQLFFRFRRGTLSANAHGKGPPGELRWGGRGKEQHWRKAMEKHVEQEKT